MILRLLIISSLLTLSACSNKLPLTFYEGERNLNEVATLYLPLEIDLLDVDERAVTLPLFLNSDYQAQFLPGKHRITVRYKTVWKSALSGEGEVVKSQPVRFDLEMKAGQTYRIPLADLHGHQSALNFVKNIQLNMLHNGQQVAVSKPVERYRMQKTMAERQSHLDRLKANWRQASQEEKASFKTWLEQTEQAR